MSESNELESLNSPRLQNSNNNHHNFPHSLEATEIDYLRKIVYSYMMGTDPVTMAKVIVAVLKFPEDEKRRLIENEKLKNTTWLPKFQQTPTP